MSAEPSTPDRTSTASTSSPAPSGPTIVGGDGLLAAHRRRAAHPRRRRRGDRRQHRPRPHRGRRRRARRARRRRLRHPDLADAAPRRGSTTSLVERWLPDGMGHVFFTSGGSESADSALRLARAYHLACGPPGALEGHRPPPELPRPHARRPGRRQPPRPAGRATSRCCSTSPRCRGTTPTPLGEMIEREGADTIAGVPVRADHRRRRRLPHAARRLLARRRGRLPAPRHPAHRRRGDDRVRPHRPALGPRALPDPARRPLRRQGPRRRLRADRAWSRRPTRSSTRCAGSGFMFFTFTGSRRDVRRRGRRARRDRGRAPRRALGGDGRRPRRPARRRARRPPGTSSTSAAAACSAASSWRRAAARFAAGRRRRVPGPRHVDLPGRVRARCPTP